MQDEQANSAGRAGLLSGRRKLYVFGAAAAVLLVGAAALYGVLTRDSGPVIASAGIIQGDVLIRSPREAQWRQLNSTTARIVPGTRLRSTLSGRIALDLSAQTSLRLDAGSEVMLTGERAIELVSGTIYVDSSADASAAPFTINTSRGAVQSIGAQTAVALVDDALYVSVRSGDIELAEDAEAIPIAASAGEGFQVLAGDSPRRERIRTYGSGWTWVETLSSAPDFQGETLEAFLDWFMRETGRPLRFDDSTTEARAATTTLSVDVAGLDAMRALEIVLSTTTLEYDERYDGAILIAPR